MILDLRYCMYRIGYTLAATVILVLIQLSGKGGL